MQYFWLLGGLPQTGQHCTCATVLIVEQGVYACDFKINVNCIPSNGLMWSHTGQLQIDQLYNDYTIALHMDMTSLQIMAY